MKKILFSLVIAMLAITGFGQENKQLLELVSGPNGISIDSLNGKETILKSQGVYSFVNPKFKEWNLDQTGSPTGKTIVDVYKLKSDATFAEVFTSIGEKEKKVLSQAQINNFSKNHQELLTQLENQMFFFFQVGGDYFVASLCIRGIGRPIISPLRLSYDRSWHPSSDPEVNFYFVIPRFK